MSSTTTISPTPSSTASSNGADSCGSMGPQYAPSTCPRTTSYDTTSTLLETAEFLENVPQSFRNAHQLKQERLPLKADLVQLHGDVGELKSIRLPFKSSRRVSADVRVPSKSVAFESTSIR